MSPSQCADCAILFMRINATDKLCNSCLNKQNQKIKKKGIDMMKIQIECTPDEAAEIEEYCISNNISLSFYFMGLHRLNFSEKYTVKKDAEIDENHLKKQKAKK
jgi:hypothetical protein